MDIKLDKATFETLKADADSNGIAIGTYIRHTLRELANNLRMRDNDREEKPREKSPASQF